MRPPPARRDAVRAAPGMSDLDALEAEAIHILREVAAGARRPVLLYSMGKDSTVLLHLARKAFHPARQPFPLLHVDTGWKFRDMYRWRDAVAANPDVTLIVHINRAAVAAGLDPLTDGDRHTDLFKTEGLKQAITLHGFDIAIGGARRDEEKSRAKERIVSVRTADHGWDPTAQRPELWTNYNLHIADGETLRVFPLSNWTEIDVWRYIEREGLEVLPLYFASDRPVVVREGRMLVIDDDRLGIDTSVASTLRVRFRSLGCYPLTSPSLSDAASVAAIIEELRQTGSEERIGRAIDRASDGHAMEVRKRHGYF